MTLMQQDNPGSQKVISAPKRHGVLPIVKEVQALVLALSMRAVHLYPARHQLLAKSFKHFIKSSITFVANTTTMQVHGVMTAEPN